MSTSNNTYNREREREGERERERERERDPLKNIKTFQPLELVCVDYLKLQTL